MISYLFNHRSEDLNFAMFLYDSLREADGICRPDGRCRLWVTGMDYFVRALQEHQEVIEHQTADTRRKEEERA